MEEINRRKVLKKAGASIAIGGIGVNTVSATGTEEHNEANIHLDNVIESENVAALLDESNATVYEDEVETEITTTKQGTIASTSIPTDLGVIKRAEINGQDLGAAILEIDDTKEARKRLDLTAEIGLKDTEAALVSTEDETILTREATTEEQRQARQSVDFEPSEIYAYATDTDEGYLVHEGGDEPNGGIKLNGRFEETGSIESIDSNSSVVQPQRDVDCSGDDLVSCLSVLFPLPTPCLSCGFVCGPGQTVPGAGQAACLVCLAGACGPYVLAHAACAGCIG